MGARVTTPGTAPSPAGGVEPVAGVGPWNVETRNPRARKPEMKTKTESLFDTSFADGGFEITKDYGSGLVVVAGVTSDPHEVPDPEVYNAADIAAWERGEWTFWDMWFAVKVAGLVIRRVVVLGGIDCVDDDYRNDDHLDSIANDQLRQLDVAGIVRDFAAKVTAASEAAGGAR